MSFYKQFMPSPALSGLIRAFEIYQVNWHSGKNLPEPFITCLANTEQCHYFYVNDTKRIVPAENVEIPVPPIGTIPIPGQLLLR